MKLSEVAPGTTVHLPGLPISAVVGVSTGTSINVTVDGKRTTWSSDTIVILKMAWTPIIQPIPVTPKTIVKKWKPAPNRPSARRFFIDTLKKSITISFNEMWDRLTDMFPDMKCGSCPVAARQMFNMYRYQVRIGKLV